MAIGALTGLILGLWSFGGPVPVPDLLGEYDALPRRLMRLGHIAFFGLGVLNILMTTRIAFPVTSDTTAPRLRLVSRTPPRIAVSEPASVRLRVNGAVRRLRVTEAGTVTIPGIRGVRTLIASAQDAVGNRSRVLTVR